MSSWGSKFSNLQQVGDFSIFGSKSSHVQGVILKIILALVFNFRLGNLQGYLGKSPRGVGLFFTYFFQPSKKKSPTPWGFSQVCWLMKIFDEVQLFQKYHPPQTKMEYLFDLCISSNLKGIVIKCCL